jgi:hypothetical protein
MSFYFLKTGEKLSRLEAHQFLEMDFLKTQWNICKLHCAGHSDNKSCIRP